MEGLVIALGIYVGVGFLICLLLVFRKGKSPHAIKAIQLWGMDSNPVWLGVGMLLWPLWVFIQIVEQDNLEPKKELEIEEEENLELLIGRTGKAVTPMIPSGRIELDHQHYEAISVDGKLDKGEGIEVIAVSMRELKVKKVKLDD
ncbi:hypothetical protein MLD52_20885 [Puniceicoccaceae bacterium K14]|nr:hypothetical protein [Puniceicoccaceae bacterium K14]